jgi:hypothetical protein
METKLIKLIDGPRKGLLIQCGTETHQVKVVVMDDGIFKDAVYQEATSTEFKFKELRSTIEPHVIHSQQPEL